MENTKDALNAALKEAMKSKDKDRRDAIRLLTSAIKQVEVDEQKELSNEEIIDVLAKQAKQRRESIDELTKAGRTEQAQQEEYELTVIEEFLPKQLTRDEIEKLAQEAITQTGASSSKEMGKVMGALQAQIKGRADGKLVSEIVRDMLSN